MILFLAAWAEQPDKDPDKQIWSGLVLPLFGANSQDGPGFGVGGEVYSRKRSETDSYRLKISGLVWVTTNLGYTSEYLQLDLRDETEWLGRIGYRGWSNHAYAGTGGAAISATRGEREIGNRVRGPYAFLGASRPLGGHWNGFAQAYYKTYFVDAGSQSLLAEERPFGAGGGTYIDFTVGVEYDSTDRWPMPWSGVRAEWSGRAGATFAHRDDVAFLAGSYAEAIGWWTLARHFTFAGRLVGDQTLGRRPFFEQDLAGGRWRDELGSEQVFSGYGRTRTRGDGFLAAMVEFRPYFFKTNHKFLDFEFHGSTFVELGWLTRHGEAGPLLPTIGMGPQILFQGAIQMRPFIAWGWRGDEPGDRRRPVPLYGISFMDPL